MTSTLASGMPLLSFTTPTIGGVSGERVPEGGEMEAAAAWRAGNAMSDATKKPVATRANEERMSRRLQARKRDRRPVC
jgi:hypothetical protein